MLEPYGVKRAREAWSRCDGAAFADAGNENQTQIQLVACNVRGLIERGMYETALLGALTSGTVNHALIDRRVIDFLLSKVNREKFRACGSPYEHVRPFTIYRGVSRGRGTARRVRGWSWTDSLDIACWFAMSDETIYDVTDTGVVAATDINRAVYSATVSPEDIYCFSNKRNEQEYIVKPKQVKNLGIDVGEMTTRQHREGAKRQLRHQIQMDNKLAEHAMTEFGAVPT